MLLSVGILGIVALYVLLYGTSSHTYDSSTHSGGGSSITYHPQHTSTGSESVPSHMRNIVEKADIIETVLETVKDSHAGAHPNGWPDEPWLTPVDPTMVEVLPADTGDENPAPRTPHLLHPGRTGTPTICEERYRAWRNKIKFANESAGSIVHQPVSKRQFCEDQNLGFP